MSCMRLEMRTRSDPKNKVTFVCDLVGCENEKTVFKSIYKDSHNHFCSKECYLESRNGGSIKRKPKVKTIAVRIEEYFKNTTY